MPINIIQPDSNSDDQWSGNPYSFIITVTTVIFVPLIVFVASLLSLVFEMALLKSLIITSLIFLAILLACNKSKAIRNIGNDSDNVIR